MKFYWTAYPDDGEPFEITASSRDILRWEKGKPGRSITQLIGGGVRISEAYALAHVAAKRAGTFTGSLSEFEDAVDLDGREPEDEDQDDAADEEGPTQPGP